MDISSWGLALRVKTHTVWKMNIPHQNNRGPNEVIKPINFRSTQPVIHGPIWVSYQQFKDRKCSPHKCSKTKSNVYILDERRKVCEQAHAPSLEVQPPQTEGPRILFRRASLARVLFLFETRFWRFQCPNRPATSPFPSLSSVIKHDILC